MAVLMHQNLHRVAAITDIVNVDGLCTAYDGKFLIGGIGKSKTALYSFPGILVTFAIFFILNPCPIPIIGMSMKAARPANQFFRTFDFISYGSVYKYTF